MLIDNDLKRRRKRVGNFLNLGPDLWNLTYREAGHRAADGEDLVGEYVRLKAGAYCSVCVEEMMYVCVVWCGSISSAPLFTRV